MKIVRIKPTEIKIPDKLSWKNGYLWCDEHENAFLECLCPKLSSTPEKDGWSIEEKDGTMVAYPTESLYNELGLWIDKKDGDMICTRCDESMQIRGLLTVVEIEDMVDSFYEIHYGCEGKS